VSRFLISLFGLVALAAPLLADEVRHSYELTDQQLGTVRFPISCAPRVQKTFERGVALLHSFAFETAEATFRQVAQDDPHCSMAHWGIARSFWRWDTPDSATLKRGWSEVVLAESLHPATTREKEYIAAVAALYKNSDARDEERLENYIHEMERLHRDYPADDEATAFYSLALIGADRDNDPRHEKRRQAAALLEPLFSRAPNHPGVAHYLIHAYDKPDLAELGLPAARRYAQIAPAAPHALHMPSHIFARLGLWEEDINSNLASIAASRNATAVHMEDKGHQFHAMEFLVYAYLQCGHEADAQRLIEEVKTLSEMKDMYGKGYDPRLSALVSFPATYALELHDWKAAASLPEVPGAPLGDSSVTHLVRALGKSHMADIQGAERELDKIEEVRKTLFEQKKTRLATVVAQDHRIALAWLMHAEGKNEDALKMLREIADKDEGTLEAEGELPGHEMLGDMLLEVNRPREALEEYETELKLSPNRFDSLYGAARAAEMANRDDKAAAYFQQLMKTCAGAQSSRPELAYAQKFLSTVAKQN
jgi:tetratricopeptide (TPR) repeat protein